MQLQAYAHAIREDLARIAAVGDETTGRVAELLAGALEPMLGRRLQEAMTEAALELSSQLPEGRVEVRVSGGDPELIYVTAEQTTPANEPPADEALTARVTLRLSDGLKLKIEDAAATSGLSLNTWIVRTLGRAVEPRATGTTNRHRLSGYGAN